MVDAMVVDVTPPTAASSVVAKKRKRENNAMEVSLTPEERELKIRGLNEEINGLVKYFNEVLSNGVGLGLSGGDGEVPAVVTVGNLNAVIAVLLEEKPWSYGKLVSEVYDQVRERDGGDGDGGGVTIASVKASVLFVGQRVSYGVPSADADVLEDASESRLWCWETRDLKLLPKSLRGAIKTRRLCRKKINERILAILSVISSLQKPEDHPLYKTDAAKAAYRLSKVLAEADIRSLAESLSQKNGAEMAEKDAKKKEAIHIKELEKSKREAEKEKKRMDRELQKEKLQSEKEKKRLQQEAERDEKRREREESEMRKLLKRKLEDADKEQRRREKEEAELKKQLAVKKQASIMERFLKKSKTSSTSQNEESVSNPTSDSAVKMKGGTFEPVSLLMDSALQQTNDIDLEKIWNLHLNSWQQLGHSMRSNNKQHWGMRLKPKTELIKELKLTINKGPARDDDLCIDSLVNGGEELNTDDKACQENRSGSSQATGKGFRRKQLLQFDKSHRPAFYGIWPKKSCIVGPRNPLKIDPDLDYDIDSDEEWEEEDPGESLSDSDKEEEENLEEGSCKADDEEESEDEFFVPDGYLSEDEGVETDRNHSNNGAEVTPSSPSHKLEAESEEISSWIRRQKYLQNLTEHALKKNQPLIITNLMHEKTDLLFAEDLTGTLKAEQMCLQALSIRAFPGGLPIELPSNYNLLQENHKASTSNGKSSSPMAGLATAIPDSDLPVIVTAIQSNPLGINRVLETLQQRFPDFSKSQLRNKVRELSDFVDNRWKVKKEILEKLGMSSSPEKSRLGTKHIATFFSKRCLPPAGKVTNPCESSPESVKPSPSNPLQQPAVKFINLSESSIKSEKPSSSSQPQQEESMEIL